MVEIELKTTLENKIKAIIEQDNKNNCAVTFFYEEADNGVDLFIVTHNPIHNTDFLYYKTWSLTEVTALNSAFLSLLGNKKKELTFTVEWKRNDEAKSHISFFSGINMFDVLNKFYHNKVESEYSIFQIKLNPIS